MSEEFLQKYKELEQLILENFEVEDGTGAVWALGAVPEYIPLRPQLNAIREIRNFLAHTPMFDDQPLITPTPTAIRIVDNIISKIEKPKTIYNICVKPSNILCAKVDDQIAPVVKLMRERSFQVVPLLDNGKVAGVYFDSAAIYKEIENDTLGADTTFFQLRHSTDLNTHIGHDVLFTPKTATIESVKIAVNDYFQSGNRIGAIFVTENGKTGEALLGMVLPLQLID
jgi:CBS domain-containing protein